MPDDTTGASFFDDFPGDLSDQWLGDIASFRVVGNRLGPVEQASAPISIAIPSPRLRNTVWEAGIQVAGAFNTSNYVTLYIAATNSSLRDPQNGYHLQIDGVDDNHVYRLWRQNGRMRTVIFESGPIANRENRFRARIRVTCTDTGRWQVLADEYDRGSFAAVASKDGHETFVDDTYVTGGYSGYLVSFSPTRRNDFKLDYLLIKPLDPTAPNGPDVLRPGDILINEILSNPKPDGVDFVELYNYSSNAVNLSQLDIAPISTNGVAGPRRKITDRPMFLHPNEYKVLTTKPAIVGQHYPKSDTGTFIEMPTLPNFNNETGGVVLYRDSLVIDSLFYTSAMQSPFIMEHKGVSLERQYFSEPANAPGNFQSAAVSIGGATPGYQNSRRPADADAAEGVFLASKTFSPDHDGFEDQLEINYRFGKSGFMANIDIYTDQGQLARRLQRNQSMATQGTISWDGLSDTHQRLPIGIYIAVIEIYHADGARKIYRKSFVLAAKQ